MSQKNNRFVDYITYESTVGEHFDPEDGHFASTEHIKYLSDNNQATLLLITRFKYFLNSHDTKSCVIVQGT